MAVFMVLFYGVSQGLVLILFVFNFYIDTFLKLPVTIMCS